MAQQKIEEGYYNLLDDLKSSELLDAQDLTIIRDHDLYLRDKHIYAQKDLRKKLERRILSAQRRNEELERKLNHKQEILARASGRIREHETKLAEFNKALLEKNAFIAKIIPERNDEIAELKHKLNVATTPIVFENKDSEKMMAQLRDRIKEIEDNFGVERSALEVAGKETERFMQEKIDYFKAELKMRDTKISNREATLIDQQHKHDCQLIDLGKSINSKIRSLEKYEQIIADLNKELVAAEMPWYKSAGKKIKSMILSDKLLFHWFWECDGFWGK